MKGTVYKCTFSDGKVYIGKSIRVGQRLKEHLDNTTGPSNPGFYNAYKRFGEPKFEILFQEDFSNILEREVTLCGVETYYIDFFHATDPRYGYNIKRSSPMSAGARKAIEGKIDELTNKLENERLKDYYIIWDKLCNKKESLTPAELHFVKEKFREKNIWHNSIDKFDFHDYNQNSYDDWLFLVDDVLPMIECIIKTDTKEEVLQYVYNNAEEIFKDANEKTILRINEYGDIKEFKSINDICEDMKVDRPDNIRNVLRGKQKKAYDFFWIYKKDYEYKLSIIEKNNSLF